jgi:hypothetical protein
MTIYGRNNIIARRKITAQKGIIATRGITAIGGNTPKIKEYVLISHGTESIILNGINPNPSLKKPFKFESEVFYNADSFAQSYDYNGDATSLANNRLDFSVYGISSGLANVRFFGVNTGYFSDFFNERKKITLEYRNSQRYSYIDNNFIYSSSASEIGISLYVFRNNNPSTASKRYSVKVWRDNILVADLIPVPAGNTTYSTTPAPSNCMFDLVRGQYFENQGTGNFDIEEL